MNVCRLENALSLRDLEALGRLWGAGSERRALCPFCGDNHKRDQAHACLAVNVETGAWHCHRCERSGLLEERKASSGEQLPRRGAPCEPSPAELQEHARRRARLRRLWSAAEPIDAPAAGAGADYLWSRGIPLVPTIEARVRFAGDWYGRPAVVFPMQDASGRLVAAEGRYVDGRTDPKDQSAGAKSCGVFVATPGALDMDGAVVCEGPITALSVAACGLPTIALCGHVLRPWLAWRLALRTVFVTLDWDEQDAERYGDAACRALANVGARPYRLALPAGSGDWNDHLRAVGLAAMRAELRATVSDVHPFDRAIVQSVAAEVVTP